jgi:hypothetical protein
LAPIPLSGLVKWLALGGAASRQLSSANAIAADTEILVVEVLPQVKAIIERQDAVLQLIAMRIMEFPKEGRQEACRAARRSFEVTVAQFRIDPEGGVIGSLSLWSGCALF